MRQKRIVAALVIIGWVLVAGWSMQLVGDLVEAQPPMLIFGQSSGTPKAVATNSSGQIQVEQVPNTTTTADPCVSPLVAKSSVAVTATGQQVALTASQKIFVCGLYATMGGTSPTVTLQYGTGANCATGTTALSGAFAPTVGNELILGHGGTIASTATSNALCISLAGTTPTIAGILSYVKQ